MTEQTATPSESVTPQASEPANTQVPLIPKPRFNEVNEARKAAEAKLEEYARVEEMRNRSELETISEFNTMRQQLEDQLRAAKSKAEAWDQYQAERQDALLAGLSDDDKKLAEGLPLGKLEALVARLAQSTTTPTGAVGVPGGAANVPAGKVTPEEIRKHASDPAWLRANWERIQQS